jgi:hypothetical protein
MELATSTTGTSDRRNHGTVFHLAAVVDAEHLAHGHAAPISSILTRLVGATHTVRASAPASVAPALVGADITR